MSILRVVIRRPLAAQDVEMHATYIAEGSIDAAVRFLERVEQTFNALLVYPATGALFPTQNPELVGIRTRLVKDFPNHVVFYIERDNAIEVIRVLRGGQDLSVKISES